MTTSSERAVEAVAAPSQSAAPTSTTTSSTMRNISRPLRVVLATPLGKSGKGGMDRLADLVIDYTGKTCPERVAVTRITTKGGDSKLVGSFYFAVALAHLLGLMLLRRVDVLHINMAAYGSFYRKALIAGLAELFRVPYIGHIHSGRFQPFWTEARGRKLALVNRFMRKSAGIVVLGRIYQELVEKMVPDCSGRVVVLANATGSRPPRSWDETAAGKPVQISFLGVLADFKGVPQLLEALSKLAHRDDWVATLAGDGEYAGTEARVRELGLSGRVSLPGWIKSEEAAALLDRTDIFVLPSFSEGQPMSILEAFAASAAVVATPVNAVRDVVEDDRNGLLVTPGNVEELKDAIERLIDDPALRQKLATNAYADHQEKYAIAAHVGRLLVLWERAALGAGTQGAFPESC